MWPACALELAEFRSLKVASLGPPERFDLMYVPLNICRHEARKRLYVELDPPQFPTLPILGPVFPGLAHDDGMRSRFPPSDWPPLELSFGSDIMMQIEVERQRIVVCEHTRPGNTTIGA